MLLPPKFNVQSRASKQVALFQELTDDQKEFFMALLPNWYFSVEELIEATKLLA